MNDGYRIFPLGDSALTIEFGNDIALDLNNKAIALANYLEEHQFPGFLEAVPAYASTTIFYDVVELRRASPDAKTAYEAVKTQVIVALDQSASSSRTSGRLVDIPMHFDPASSPDIQHVADANGLTPEAVIDIFTDRTYRVFMLGFLPGFTYMAEVDERIATRRRESPRQAVPRGSVGIAGKQTGIYSLESPGGWQIIGRTDVEVFTPHADRPTLLSPGDHVRFVRAG